MGFDPPAQSDTSYEVDALPSSHHGWIIFVLVPFKFITLLFRKPVYFVDCRTPWSYGLSFHELVLETGWQFKAWCSQKLLTIKTSKKVLQSQLNENPS